MIHYVQKASRIKPKIKSSAKALYRESNKLEKDIVGYLIKELKALQAAVDIDDLAAVLSTAKEKELLQIVDAAGMRTTFKDLDALMLRGAVAGATVTAKEMGVTAILDPTRARLKKWLKEHAAELVKETWGTSKLAIKQTVTDGIIRGRHPKRLAQDVKQSIGLTERDAGAVAKRRDWLDGKVSAGELSPVKAETMGDSYADKLLTRRAENIARTESMTMVNQGRQELWSQLVEDGAMPATQMKEWDATKDMATCSVCRDMHKQRVKIDAPFETPDGDEVLAPPAHPSCRCTMLIR